MFNLEMTAVAEEWGQGCWDGGMGWGWGVSYGRQLVTLWNIQYSDYLTSVNTCSQPSFYG